MKTKNKTPADVETVTITMSRKTAEAVKQACEEYLRLRMGQFEDFTNEVCCWDYAEQMEKECHTTEERKKFHRDHEQDFTSVCDSATVCGRGCARSGRRMCRQLLSSSH